MNCAGMSVIYHTRQQAQVASCFNILQMMLAGTTEFAYFAIIKLFSRKLFSSLISPTALFVSTDTLIL